MNRYPLSLSRISRHLSKDSLISEAGSDKPNKFNSRIVVVVGTVTNDSRLTQFPQGVKICALKFTNAARARIQKQNGQCLTFDQLAQLAPTGKNVLLLRGPRDREAKRHFGLYPGQKGSHSAPRVRTEGRKWERARGRRWIYLSFYLCP